MKKRAVKIALSILVIGCSLGGGYYMGNLNRKDDTKPVALLNEEKPKKEELYDTELIAIVNADEGIKKQEDIISYSQSLLGTLNVKYEVTGLEDAKQGIENGKYSAYIILPGTFSEAVESINGTPQKAVLEYAIAPNLTQDAQAEAIYSVGNAYTTLNNGISELYLSSILTEVHKVQDAAGNIKENDIRDLKALGEVSGDDLREAIELPELAAVEKNIEVLDLVPHYEEEDKLLAEIDKTYQEAWNTSREEYGNIQKQMGAVSGQFSPRGNFNTAVNAFQNNSDVIYPDYIDTSETEKGQLGVIKENILKVASKAESQIKMISEEAKGFSEQYNFILSAYANTIDKLGKETKSETCRQNGFTFHKNQYEFYNAEKVENEFAALEQRYNEGLNDYYNTVVNFEINDGLKKVKDNMQRMYNILSESNPQKYPPISNEVWETYVKNAIPMPQNELEETKRRLTDLNEKVIVESYELVDKIPMPDVSLLEKLNLSGDLKTLSGQMVTISAGYADARENIIKNVNDELKNNITQTGEKVENLKKSYGDLKNMASDLDNTISEYDLEGFLNKEAIGTLEQSLDKNQSTIEDKIENQNKQYESYVEEVYKTSEDNTKRQSESIEAGEKASNEKLDTNLANAKSLKQSTYEDNKLMLNDIGGVLPYSRLGTQENVMAYRFMTEPLSVNDLTVAKKENVKGQEVNVGVSDEKKEIEEKEIPIFIWVISVILLVVFIGSYFALRKKRTDSNEDHL